MSKVLVFDFGASSARAIIVSFDGKTFGMNEIHRFPNEPITADGTLYWDIDRLLGEVKTALGKAVTEGIEAVSVDTWGVDFAVVADDGSFIERPVHYRDNRTRAVIDEVNGLFGGAEKLYLRTGIQPAWFNTIYQIYALKKVRPESLERGHFLMMPDLICNFLTGEFHNEYAEATTSSLLDPETKSWDKDILRTLGINDGIFCDMINSGEVFGYMKPEFAGDRKIPVIAVPSHDTAAAVTAVPASEKEFAFISTGTWALFGTELDRAVISREAFDAGLTNEGGHSGTVTFLKNIMGMWLFQECRRSFRLTDSGIGFPEMEKLAEAAEPLKYFIDPNDSSFAQPDDMPEKISAYIKRTGQGDVTDMGALLRAVYDSLAAEFAVTLDDIERITGRKFDAVYMFGGGTKDRLICRLTADYTGKRVVAGPTEATALGNAVSALIGIGALGSVAEAREIIRRSGLTKEYEPNFNYSAKERYKAAVK